MSFLLSNSNPQSRVATAPVIAQIDPPVSGPALLQYSIGQMWVNSSSNIVFMLTSVSNGQGFWQQTIAGAPGVFTDLTVDPGPTAITGEFRVNGNIDEAEVIRLRENGGTSGSIEIASLQGTGADSISISSGAGGIEIATAAAAKDILVSAGLGSIGIVAGEDAQDALIIQADGGTSSGLLIENTSGTGFGSAVAAAIGILATNGAVYVESQDAIAGAIVLDASNAVGGMLLNSGTGGTDFTSTGNIASSTTLGDITLTADAGNVDITATLGALNFTAGGGISYSVTGAINLDATSTSHFTVTGAAEDLILSSVGGSVDMSADEAVADAIVINASAGGFEIDGVLTSHATVTGAAADLNLSSVGGSVNITASEVVSDAIVINASAGGMNLSAVGHASLVTTGGGHDINIQSTSDKVALNAGSATADAIILSAFGAGAGIEIAPDATTASVTIANITPTVTRTTTINGGVVNAAHTDTLNLGVGGTSTNASANKIVNIATGTATLGVQQINMGNADALTAINARGVVTINNTSTGATTIGNSTNGGAIIVATNTSVGIDSKTASHITVTGAANLTLSSTAGSVAVTSSQAAATAVNITAPAGGVTLSGGAAATLGNVGIVNQAQAAAAGPSATVTVVNNSRIGSITFTGYTQAASATLVLTLTNSFITATSPIIASTQNAGANDAQMQITRIKQGSGTADITIKNQGAAALNGDMVMSFMVLA